MEYRRREQERAAQPRIAIGAAYEGRDPDLLARMLPFVDYLEITLETIAEVHGDAIQLSDEVMAELRDIGHDVQFIVHGVGLSIGSHEGWSTTYLYLLDRFLDRVDVAWHSEHLAYTKVNGQHLGIMLAMPRTEEALDLICERVAEIQRRYPMPFLLENIVHVVPDCEGDYSDAAFLNALTHRTGCRLLLDAYNLECDAHNHDFDISAFLAELDHSTIHEVHVACGVEHNGFMLDVHSQLTRDSTLGLAHSVIAKSAGSAKVLVYEFMPEAVPGIGRDAIAGELSRMRRRFGH